MGTSFGWDSEPIHKSPALIKQTQEANSLAPSTIPPTSASIRPPPAGVPASPSTLAVGTRVIYTQMGNARTELDAEVVEIEEVGSRRDNIRIRFMDGRERNTSADKLKVVAVGEEKVSALPLGQVFLCLLHNFCELYGVVSLYDVSKRPVASH